MKIKVIIKLRKVKQALRRTCQLAIVIILASLIIGMYGNLLMLPETIVIFANSMTSSLFSVMVLFAILMGTFLLGIMNFPTVELSELRRIMSILVAVIGAISLYIILEQKNFSVLGMSYTIRSPESFGYASVMVAFLFFVLVIILSSYLAEEETSSPRTSK